MERIFMGSSNSNADQWRAEEMVFSLHPLGNPAYSCPHRPRNWAALCLAQGQGPGFSRCVLP
jgi:hypothetical protein